MSGPVKTQADYCHTDNRPFGIMVMILGMISMCITDAAGKWVVQDYHVAQLNFLRGFFALLILVPTAMQEGGFTSLKTNRPWFHAGRSILLVCIAYAWFFGLTTLPLAEATAIGLCAPLFMTALSVMFLKEKVGIFRWGAIVLGFIGMLVIIRPGTVAFDPMFLCPAFAAAGYATYMLTNRIMSRTESMTSITLYPQLLLMLASACIAPFVWEPLTWEAFGVMAITGLSAGLGHLLLSFAFKYAPPSVLAPFDYTALVWAGLFGWVLFAQLPDQVALIGMSLIVAAGLIVIYREAVAARRIVSVPLA
jgi:drug/metabolite transporter (DMT)-like permease